MHHETEIDAYIAVCFNVCGDLNSQSMFEHVLRNTKIQNGIVHKQSKNTALRVMSDDRVESGWGKKLSIIIDNHIKISIVFDAENYQLFFLLLIGIYIRVIFSNRCTFNLTGSKLKEKFKANLIN